MMSGSYGMGDYGMGMYGGATTSSVFLSYAHDDEVFLPRVLLDEDNTIWFAPEPVDSLVQRLAKRIVGIGKGDHTATMKEHGRVVTAILMQVVALLRKNDVG